VSMGWAVLAHAKVVPLFAVRHNGRAISWRKAARSTVNARAVTGCAMTATGAKAARKLYG
jgi:hypothetical protein